MVGYMCKLTLSKSRHNEAKRTEPVKIKARNSNTYNVIYAPATAFLSASDNTPRHALLMSCSKHLSGICAAFPARHKFSCTFVPRSIVLSPGAALTWCPWEWFPFFWFWPMTWQRLILTSGTCGNMAWTTFLFVLFSSFLTASALYFHIGETEKKCFIEEIPDETMVVGK